MDGKMPTVSFDGEQTYDLVSTAFNGYLDALYGAGIIISSDGLLALATSIIATVLAPQDDETVEGILEELPDIVLDRIEEHRDDAQE